jgi:hypothetical protein
MLDVVFITVDFKTISTCKKFNDLFFGVINVPVSFRGRCRAKQSANC